MWLGIWFGEEEKKTSIQALSLWKSFDTSSLICARVRFFSIHELNGLLFILLKDVLE